MDRHPDLPWNPRVSADISPTDFEKLVLEWLRLVADRQEQTITTKHLGVVHGDGGQYKVDVLVTFSALGGALFVVLVECKHQTRPVEREDVMVLESKLRDVNAQKAMLFSTSGFQSGALEFAAAKHIATVTVVEGDWLYETRAGGAGRQSLLRGSTSIVTLPSALRKRPQASRTTQSSLRGWTQSRNGSPRKRLGLEHP